MGDPIQAGRLPSQDPFDAVFQQGGQSAQSSSADPFDAVFGATTQPGEAPPAVAEPVTIGDQMQQTTSPAMLQGLESADLAQQRERLKALLARTDLKPGHRKRLERLLKQYSVPTVLGMELTNRPTERRDPRENVVRGLGAGALNYGILAPFDLVAGAGQMILSGPLEPLQKRFGLDALREKIADNQAAIRDFFDAQGWAGTAGTVVGGLAGGLKPWQILNSTGMTVASKIPGIGPRLAAIVYRGTLPAATYLERLAANAVGSGVVDVVQLADVLTDENATEQQKIVGVMMTALMSGGSAALYAIRPNAADARPVGSDPNAPALPGKLDEQGASPAKAAQADAMTEQAKAAKAAAEHRQKVNLIARKTWEAQNPGKSWKSDLSKNEQLAWMKQFREQFRISDQPKPTVDPQQTEMFQEPKPEAPSGEAESGVVGEKGIPAGGDAEIVPPSEPQMSRGELFVRAVLGSQRYANKPFDIAIAKEIYGGMEPQSRADLFGKPDEWQSLSIAERTKVFEKMRVWSDDSKARRVSSSVDTEIRRANDITQAEDMLSTARDGGDVRAMHDAEEWLSQLGALPEGVNPDAVLTRVVQKTISGMPKDRVTAIMRDLFNGNAPADAAFASNASQMQYLVEKLGAKYDPKYEVSARASKPGTTKPKPSTRSRGEPTPPDTPSPSPLPEANAVEELKAELARTKVERDEAIRARDVDVTTGYANKDALLRAQPAADADPTKEYTYFDITNFKALNDNVGNVAADAELKRIAQSIEAAMRAVGMVSDEPGATVRLFRQGDEFVVIHERGRSAELIKAAKEIVGSQDVQVGDAFYPIRLRGAHGKTWEEAGLAINRVKGREPKSSKAPRKPAADAQPLTDFYGVKIKKPVAEMSRDEITQLQDALDELANQGKMSDAVLEQASKELSAAERVIIETEKPGKEWWDSKTPVERAAVVGERQAKKDWDFVTDKSRKKVLDLVAKERPSADTSTPETPKADVQEDDLPSVETLPQDPSAPARRVSKASEQKAESLDPAIALARAEKFNNLIRKPPAKLLDDQLLWLRDEVQSRVSAMGKLEAKQNGYAEILAKLNEEIASRFKGRGGGLLQTHPAATGAAAGVVMGLVMPADDNQERLSNALYWGLAGAAGATYLRNMKRAIDASVPSYQRRIRKHVRSVEDAPLERRTGIYTKLMRAYGNIVRRDIGITNVSKLAGAKDMPANRSSGKMAEMFGLWRGITDQWLMGDRVGYWDNNGEFVQLPAKTLRQIAEMVNGDTRTVGDLAAAYRELTLRGLEEPRTIGIEMEDARQMIRNTPEVYHRAAEELHKLFRAMRDMSVAAGLLSKESAAKMDEQGFYVAVRRLFDNQPGTSPELITSKGGRRGKSTGPSQEFKHLKGGRLPMQNPVEALIDLMPRYQRAAELNRLMVQFFDEVMTLPPKQRQEIAKPVKLSDLPEVAKARAEKLRAELEKEGVTNIGEAEAQAIVASVSDESLNMTSDIVRFFRNGKMEAWKVSEPVARAFKAMQPHELAAFLESAGLLTKPTNIARVGITANPVFVGNQAFRDVWQYHQNGTYAPAPDSPLISRVAGAATSLPKSAAGWLRGWLNIMFNTPAHREYRQAGAGGESVASQGLRVVRGDIKKSTELLERIREPSARTQFGKIAKEIKQMHWREAYASILQPIADAGRFGAYLHERGRGANVIEAIYKSKKYGANFSNRGSSLMLQAANRMTLFLNPAIQSLDASRWAFQRDPVGYIARGIMGTAAISAALWAAYDDDEEIKQLRNTAYGSKYWWMRVNGEIVKLPKPIFEGQVFGTSVESWLEHKKNQDPLAYRRWVEAMYNDAAVNLLPFMGVVPVSLMTNKVVVLGSSVVPEGTSNLDVEYRARPTSTYLARRLSSALAPTARAINSDAVNNALSPAGLDFIVSQYLGGLGSEMSKALSIAVEAQDRGTDLPPKEELPFVRSIFGSYPSLGVQSINEFYTFADRADQAAATVNYLAGANPEKLADYMQERMPDLMLSKMYSETRAKLVDFRKAIEDIRQAPPDVMTNEQKRELTQLFLRQMIDLTRATNEAARSIRSTMETTAGK